MAQMVRNLPAIWETWIGSLGREDPLKKEIATHSSILAWRIPWTEEPGGLQSMGSQRAIHNCTYIESLLCQTLIQAVFLAVSFFCVCGFLFF